MGFILIRLTQVTEKRPRTEPFYSQVRMREEVQRGIILSLTSAAEIYDNELQAHIHKEQNTVKRW